MQQLSSGMEGYEDGGVGGVSSVPRGIKSHMQ